jgi:ornithine carbamoyltransferase
MLSHFLRTADMAVDDLTTVLDVAKVLKEDPNAMHTLLADDVVALYFSKPSTRTRVSFAAAIRHLGAIPEPLGAGDLQLGRGETIEDTARVISSFVRAFVIRTFDHVDVERFAAAASIPVINALTDAHHPCQSLADLLTLREQFGQLSGVRVAYVGDGNNVSHSLMEAGALAGMDVVVATPDGYGPAPAIVEEARRIAQTTGGRITITDDPMQAVAAAHAVYTDVWLSMGDPDDERVRRTHDLTPYRVDATLMAAAPAHAVFMHCLPAHRGQEVSADVIDGPQSVVFRQAANRMPTEQAVLAALVEGRLRGRATAEVRA